MSLLNQRIAVLTAAARPDLIKITKGIEKESLRVAEDGMIAHTAHPEALGSALTHPHITTDYSEALLEFITEPDADTEKVLSELDRIQQYTYQNINGERLWVGSMPCKLGEDGEIPVAQYGSSNSGRMKTVYRLGLGERYGRSMQTIAGIHYNFSVNEELWQFWYEREANAGESFRDFKDRRYFDLIRNFRRYFWLLLYLFGASPAVCGSFVAGRSHSLQPTAHSPSTLHAPYATSLRMGDLGYQSSAQDSLVVCYNELPSYLQTLCGAITGRHDGYEQIGVRNGDGDYQQLNTGLLQIENEFYSTIRPKRTARSGETALSALDNRGVEYIEVRCIDLNPYEPLGINKDQIEFLDVFLMYCLIDDSTPTDDEKYRRAQENQRRVVYSGRDPEMRLLSSAGEQSLPQWGRALLDEMQSVAKLLDQVQGSDCYSRALDNQYAKLDDPSLTPSARILEDMASEGISYFELMMKLSDRVQRHYQSKASADFSGMHDMAEQSLAAQSDIEANDTISFDDYLAQYYRQYTCC